MNLHDLFFKPYENVSTINIVLEAVATALGIASVYYSVKKNIWVYPTGIVSTVIFVYLYYNSGLLGDCMINFYYTVMSIYGWVLWAKNSDESSHIDVAKATKKEWFYAAALFIFSVIFVTIIYYYKPFIDNKFVMNGAKLGLEHLDWANWTDIFTTAVFLVGMWLMAKRKKENWIFWIIGDLICIPMMIYKKLGITSIQYMVFTIMAIQGYIEWERSYRKTVK